MSFHCGLAKSKVRNFKNHVENKDTETCKHTQCHLGRCYRVEDYRDSGWERVPSVMLLPSDESVHTVEKQTNISM